MNDSDRAMIKSELMRIQKKIRAALLLFDRGKFDFCSITLEEIEATSKDIRALIK